MRVIEINLATRPFRNNTLYWTGFGSAAVVLAGVTILNAWLFFGYGSTVRRHQEDFGQKQQRREVLAKDEQRLSLKLTKLDFKSLGLQSEFANDAIRQRTFSWTELFNRLEEVVPPTVMMTAIRPEIQAEGISIMAEGTAKNQEALLDFEENLIRNAHFSRIFPGSERREQRGADLRFSLKFEYVPQGRPVTAPPSGEKASTAQAQTAPSPSTAPSAAAAAGAEKSRTAATASAPGTPGKPPVGPRPLPAVIPPAQAATPGGSGGVPPATAGAGASAPSTPAAQGAPAPHPAGPATASRPAVPGATSQAAARDGRGRPLLKVGAPQPGSGGVVLPNGPVARKEAEVAAAARFVDRPLQDVFDYLMKARSMTFVFAGDFDLRQKVTLDLNDKPEGEILEVLAKTLECTVAREGPHAFRLSPKSGAEPLEDRPVEEEPAPPPDDGSDNSGQEPPP